MKKTILTIAAACLIAAPISFAHSQETNSNKKANKPANRSSAESRVNRRVDYLTTVLSLTNSQQEQARKIFANVENENSAVFKNLRTEREDLRKAVNDNAPSGTIKKFSDAIGNNVGNLVANEANASEQFRTILTPEQQTKFTQLKRETRGWRSFHGARAFEG
jgi:Spy/CpxP family protein refolding chaperone